MATYACELTVCEFVIIFLADTATPTVIPTNEEVLIIGIVGAAMIVGVLLLTGIVIVIGISIMLW